MKKLISTLIILTYAVSAPTATIYVDANGTGDYPTIQAAIENVNNGDTIIVQPGIYYENINFNGKNIILSSADPSNRNIIADTVIDGSLNDSVVTFSGNETSECSLTGFTITNGRNQRKGAGIYGSGTKAEIKNNIISGNILYADWWPSSVYGAGVFDCDGLIQYNVISRNEGYPDEGSACGGGLFGCDGIIRDNLITGNVVGGLVLGTCAGGGLYSCNGIIQNNTISGNYAITGGGIADCNGIIGNCIVYGNTEPQIDDLPGTSLVIFSDVQGGWPGLGNFNYDPCFVIPGYWDPNGTPNAPGDDFWVDGDFHLLPDSPCINSGDPNYVPEPNETDLDGLPRVLDGRIDMGAYEFQPPTPEELLLDLSDYIDGLNLHEGTANSLKAKLATTIKNLNDNNGQNNTSLNAIKVFINAIEAQRGKKIPTADADELIAAAQNIIEMMNSN